MSLSLRSPLLTALGFRHGFSLRDGGVSQGPHTSLNLGRGVGDDPAAVQENLRRFARDVGYDPALLHEVNQVHGGAVALAQGAPRAEPCAADALVSQREPVGIRVADCVAVLLADTSTGAVAAAHAGWRGVVANVAGNAVRRLCELGDSAPSSLAAAVFPCIGVAAFEVGADVAAQLAAASEPCVVQPGAPLFARERRETPPLLFARERGQTPPLLFARERGQTPPLLFARERGQTPPLRPHVDLQRAVKVQLIRAGLAEARVQLVSGCTFSEPARFFSYRRDGGVTGRHLAVIIPRC